MKKLENESIIIPALIRFRYKFYKYYKKNKKNRSMSSQIMDAGD